MFTGRHFSSLALSKCLKTVQLVLADYFTRLGVRSILFLPLRGLCITSVIPAHAGMTEGPGNGVQSAGNAPNIPSPYPRGDTEGFRKRCPRTAAINVAPAPCACPRHHRTPPTPITPPHPHTGCNPTHQPPSSPLTSVIPVNSRHSRQPPSFPPTTVIPADNRHSRARGNPEGPGNGVQSAGNAPNIPSPFQGEIQRGSAGDAHE